MTKRRLEELRHELTERDNAILEALRDCRYLTGQQIVRLYFGGNAESQTAQFSAAYRCLNRLRDYGLIKSLQRRIGGVRAGSGSYVWRLTQAGFRLLHMYSADRQIHKPYREPSLTFLSHTLLISEAWVQLTEICAKHDFVIAGVQFEPDSWRYYFARLGKTDTLKPDLYAAIRSDGYEDHWFIEIDRDTETVARILEKCERYIHYQRTGAEQQQSGVFPYVVWIVPDARRKNSLISHISKER
ncbi:MAG: replication-relaxation family protein [Oscillospiraceae bacterium]|nr:replication-relaxation family protein [Oscillospiraceae bacterium]